MNHALITPAVAVGGKKALGRGVSARGSCLALLIWAMALWAAMAASAHAAIPTSVSITAAPSTVVIGQPFQLTITVNAAASSALPSGTISLYEGATLFGSATISNDANATVTQMVLSFTQSIVGTHSITASYSGDSLFEPSTSAAIDLIVMEGTWSTGDTIQAMWLGQQVTLVGNVQQGYTDTTAGSTAGNYTDQTSGSSTPLWNTDFGAIGFGSDVVSLTASSTTLVEGDSVQLKARVDGFSDLLGYPGGTISFYDGQTLLGDATLVLNGVLSEASFTVNNLAAGIHDFKAVYSGDAFFSSNWSSVLSLAVSPLPSSKILTTVALSTAPPAASSAGQSIELHAQVSAESGSQPPGGTVTFFDGTTNLGSATLMPGGDGSGNSSIAVLSNATLAMGSHSLSVAYSGDGVYEASLSTSAMVLVVGHPATSFNGPTLTGTGAVAVESQGGGSGCGFIRSAFLPAPGSATSAISALTGSELLTFPHGMVDFTVSGCAAGATVTFTLTLPAAVPEGAMLYKYGPTPSDVALHWYTIPAAFNGNTVTYSITDGELGDDDLTVNGTIIDPSGVAIPRVAGGETPSETPVAPTANASSSGGGSIDPALLWALLMAAGFRRRIPVH